MKLVQKSNIYFLSDQWNLLNGQNRKHSWNLNLLIDYEWIRWGLIINIAVLISLRSFLKPYIYKIIAFDIFDVKQKARFDLWHLMRETIRENALVVNFEIRKGRSRMLRFEVQGNLLDVWQKDLTPYQLWILSAAYLRVQPLRSTRSSSQRNLSAFT